MSPGRIPQPPNRRCGARAEDGEERHPPAEIEAADRREMDAVATIMRRSGTGNKATTTLRPEDDMSAAEHFLNQAPATTAPNGRLTLH